jgi:predicted enzyme related to lactoylglutathione lyase
MPAEDMERVGAFYAKVFGWQTKQLGKEMGYYMTADTTPVGKDMRPLKTGAINGGFFKATDDPRSRLPNVVIAVDDIEAHIKKVEAAGGTVTEKPDPIPGVGLFVMFIDTEGNRVCMLQPEMPAVVK